MKFVLLLVFACTLTSAASAQCCFGRLYINHTVNGQPFDTNTVYEKDGYSFKITALRYYLSQIELVYKGGHVVKLTDLYLLVNANKTQLQLGNVQTGEIDSIRFHVGVDKEHNHLDPSSYTFNHPLYHQTPSMHWGWEGGYRFIAMDGYAGTTSQTLNVNYQVHALGDTIYTAVSVPVLDVDDGDGDPHLHITADYAHALAGIDLMLGPIEHSSEAEAATLMQNFGSRVFSKGAVTGVDDDDVLRQSTLHAYPNPSSTHVVFNSSFPDNTLLVLTDMLGREVARTTFSDSRAMVSLTDLPHGSYIASATHNNSVQSIRVSVAP
ncbi:MAG: MbnP family protein [bacterium]|nr:MbnP family protein [bacterium]